MAVTTQSVLDPKLWPADVNYCAYFSDGDLWLENLAKRDSVRLTHDVSDKTFAGFPNYCMQEEFDRFTGYYWLPKSKQTNPKLGYIVYEVVDETGVNEMNFVSLGFLKTVYFVFYIIQRRF